MTHPTREDWMSYLYDEAPALDCVALQTHLNSCAECRAQMATWQSAGRELSAWILPARRKTPRVAMLTRWAVAAAFVALAVAGGVCIATLNKEVQELRAEMQHRNADSNAAIAQAAERAATSANAETQTLIATLAQQIEQQRLADQQTTLAALQKLGARHAQDYASLRKELETVAVFSEAGLQRAQNQISSLAVTPASFSDNK